MNIANRIQIKYFIEQNEPVDFEQVIPLFHTWIRESAVPGMLIDVADYKHVPAGPGIILIGHDVDYGLDVEDGFYGLRHTRKVHRVTNVGSLADELRLAWEATIRAVTQVAQALELDFNTQKVEIRLVDRLNAPNTAETFTAVNASITAVAQTLFTQTPKLTYIAEEPRHPFTIIAEFESAPELALAATV